MLLMLDIREDTLDVVSPERGSGRAGVMETCIFVPPSSALSFS